MSLPRIQPYGEFPLTLDPPYSLDGTSCHAFWMVADAPAVARLVESTFGWAKDHVKVEPFLGIPLAGLSCVVFCHYPEASAAGPATGAFSYNEATVFLPVLVTPAGGVPFLATHIPFIYLDSVLAITAGREVLGIVKKPARITFDPTIRIGVLGARTLSSPWADMDLLSAAVSEGPRKPDGTPRIDELLRVPIVSFKQALTADAEGSLYRAVLQIPCPLRSLDHLACVGSTQVTINDVATDPMTTIFGASPWSSNLWTFTMSFGMGAGRVLYEEFAG